MPFVKPETVTGDVAPDPVNPPGFEVNVYEVIAEPLLGAAVKAIDAEALPPVATSEVAAPGIVNGVTAPEGVEGGEFPALFVATTVKVYAVPLVNPVTVSGLDAPVAVAPPGLAVTVYPVIGEPPVEEGAVNDTTTCALPGVPATAVGDPGTAAGVTELDGAEAGPAPAAFVATAVKV